MASIHALAAHLDPSRVDLNRVDSNRAVLARAVPASAVPGQARTANVRDAAVSRATAQETYYIEDGWVFREHHGKYVECICRTEEIPAVTAHNMPVFQLR
jgi:hypothetical protein